MPCFAEGVVESAATNGGLILVQFLLTSIGGSIIAGLILSLKGKYKWIAISGLVIGIVGTVLLVRLNVASGQGELLVGMLVLGTGVGAGLAGYTVVVQNAYPEKIGVVSAMLVFFRQLGGANGLAAIV